MSTVFVSGGNDDRSAAAEHVDHQTEAVSEAIIDMQTNARDLVACPGVSIGHADSYTLLQNHDVLQVGILVKNPDKRSLAGTWISEDVSDSLGR